MNCLEDAQITTPERINKLILKDFISYRLIPSQHRHHLPIFRHRKKSNSVLVQEEEDWLWISLKCYCRFFSPMSFGLMHSKISVSVHHLTMIQNLDHVLVGIRHHSISTVVVVDDVPELVNYSTYPDNLSDPHIPMKMMAADTKRIHHSRRIEYMFIVGLIIQSLTPLE